MNTKIKNLTKIFNKIFKQNNNKKIKKNIPIIF